MNQILNKTVYEPNNFRLFKNRKRFVVVFVIAIILIIISVACYILIKYNIGQKENFSKTLLSSYNVMTLYSNSSDYNAIPNNFYNYNSSKNNNKVILNNYNNSFIIGLIQIEKIGIIYPILSTTSDELLKISPCRFAGPMPNEVGNLCIAGHNYVDNKLFSKLNIMNIDDIVKIYDLSGNSINYKVYDKQEIEYNDMSCTNQNTNGKKIITLITCNNVTGKRLCIKAIET